MMQNREWRLGLVVLALSAWTGCQSGWDSERSRLEPGDKAIILVPPGSGGQPLMIPASSEDGQEKGASLSIDSSVDVIEDAGPESDKSRLVSVLVTKGPEVGRRASVARNYLFRIHLAHPEPEPFSIKPPNEKNWSSSADPPR